MGQGRGPGRAPIGRGPVQTTRPLNVFPSATPSGFGNVVFPGTGGPPGQQIYGGGRNVYGVGPGTGVSPIPFANGGSNRFGYGIGNNYGVGNYRGSRGYGYGGGFGIGGSYGFGGGTIVVPYAVPYAGYPQEYYEQPPQTGPAVVINQDYVSEKAVPQLRSYDSLPETPAPAPDSRVTIYRAPSASDDVKPLAESQYDIVMKDGARYKALGFGVEGDSLVFVTDRKRLTRVSLDQVDVPASEQANKERGIDFQLK